MGKGDKKSKKGKLWRGTFGKRRPRADKQNKTEEATKSNPKAAKAKQKKS